MAPVGRSMPASICRKAGGVRGILVEPGIEAAEIGDDALPAIEERDVLIEHHDRSVGAAHLAERRRDFAGREPATESLDAFEC